jgi:hypothetical protein
MVLNDDTGGYSGSTITEQGGAPGADGCWNEDVDPALVPEYPLISAGDSWIVGSDDSWGVDDVGWFPNSVNYIIDNSPIGSDTPIIVDFPCGAEIYQVLSIQYPLPGYSPVIFDDVTQTESVYDGYVENCREGVCSEIDQ